MILPTYQVKSVYSAVLCRILENTMWGQNEEIMQELTWSKGPSLASKRCSASAFSYAYAPYPLAVHWTGSRRPHRNWPWSAGAENPYPDPDDTFWNSLPALRWTTNPSPRCATKSSLARSSTHKGSRPPRECVELVSHFRWNLAGGRLLQIGRRGRLGWGRFWVCRSVWDGDAFWRVPGVGRAMSFRHAWKQISRIEEMRQLCTTSFFVAQ